MARRNRSTRLGPAATAVAAAGAFALSSMAQVPLADADSVFPNSDVTYAEVMGGSGTPIPSETYMENAYANYLSANFPELAFSNTQTLFTPEGLYPITGIKTLELSPSVDQGITILNSQIINDLQNNVAPGEQLGVFGYSQSAVIAGLLMSQLQDENVPSSDVNFVFIGNEINPNGGFLARFPGLQAPSLGIDFYGSAPDDLYPSVTYTLEYDGFADFPRYPLNFLADLNALAGIAFVHGKYLNYDPHNLPDGYELHALTNTVGDTLSDYYVISIPNLPLLEPLRALPLIGNPLADLLQPDLRALINMGYGDPEFGWSTSAPNVPTPFGLFPSADAFEKLTGLLSTGTARGIEDFTGDFTGTGPNPVSLSLASLLPSMADPGSDAVTDTSTSPADTLGSLTSIVDTLTTVTATGYATLLPVADIANAMLTTLPMYAADLFVSGLESGDLIGAIGDPLAASTGLFTTAAGIGVLTVINSVKSIVGDLSSLMP